MLFGRKRREQEAKAEQPMYEQLCEALDERNWKYNKDEEKDMVKVGFTTDSLPVELRLWIDQKRELVRLVSVLPFKVKEDKRVDAAIAISAVNNRMVDGSFDYDITDGHIIFRMAHSYKECKVESELFQYMVDCSVAMVEKYSAKFLGISTGMLSLEEALEEFLK